MSDLRALALDGLRGAVIVMKGEIPARLGPPILPAAFFHALGDVNIWLDQSEAALAAPQPEPPLDVERLARALHASGECNNWEPGYRHLGPAPKYEVILEVEADANAHRRSAERLAAAYRATEEGA